LFQTSDLLVVPSVAPESFGMIGVQAALEGLPSAAFDVGGISEWLTDGVTGHLAPGDPPTAEGLARAILKCLSDPSHHLALRRSAANLANRFNADVHVRELIRQLESTISPSPVVSGARR
jgi:glycosyltransferase involved in cell wall biosynthesis